MAPLSLELYSQDKNWIGIGEVKPGDMHGSISDNKPDGNRDVYLFECLPDDSKSIIYRSKAGVDTEVGSVRLVGGTGAEVVKELRRGDVPYEMRIKTDRSLETTVIRFTHV